jgi:hypothetical protein
VNSLLLEEAGSAFEEELPIYKQLRAEQVVRHVETTLKGLEENSCKRRRAQDGFGEDWVGEARRQLAGAVEDVSVCTARIRVALDSASRAAADL